MLGLSQPHLQGSHALLGARVCVGGGGLRRGQARQAGRERVPAHRLQAAVAHGARAGRTAQPRVLRALRTRGSERAARRAERHALRHELRRRRGRLGARILDERVGTPRVSAARRRRRTILHCVRRF